MVAKEDRFAAAIDLMREMVGDEAADRAVANRQAGLTEVPDELLDWAIETSFGFLMQLYEICFLLVWYCGMPSVREALDLVAEAIKDFQSAQEQQS